MCLNEQHSNPGKTAKTPKQAGLKLALNKHGEMKNMKRLNILPAVLPMLAILLSACGGESYSLKGGDDGDGGSCIGSACNGGGGNTQWKQEFAGFPTYTRTLTPNQIGSPTVTVNTDSILRIGVEALDPNMFPVPGYNFMAAYGCMSVEVAIQGRSGTRTKVLRAPGRTGCLGDWYVPVTSADHDVLNLDDELTPTGQPGPIVLEFRDPQYDWRGQYQWVQYFPMALLHYAPNTNPGPSYHTARAKFYIRTNTQQ